MNTWPDQNHTKNPGNSWHWTDLNQTHLIWEFQTKNSRDAENYLGLYRREGLLDLWRFCVLVVLVHVSHFRQYKIWRGFLYIAVTRGRREPVHPSNKGRNYKSHRRAANFCLQKSGMAIVRIGIFIMFTFSASHHHVEILCNGFV